MRMHPPCTQCCCLYLESGLHRGHHYFHSLPAASDVLAKQRQGQFLFSVVLLTRALFIIFPETIWSYMNRPYNWTHTFVPLVENGLGNPVAGTCPTLGLCDF